MAGKILADAGPPTDRRIGRLLDGSRRGAHAPAYSTDESAAQELIARLENQGIPARLEEDSGSWYCVFSAPRPGDALEERVASGSAGTRALAICRAVLNLPLTGTGSRLRIRNATRGWIEPGSLESVEGSLPPGSSLSEDAELLGPTRAARGF